MKFGISSYAFGWGIGFDGARPERPMDEHDLLRNAVELGASIVQIADNMPLESFSPKRLQRLCTTAAASGIQLEVGARRLTIERLKLYTEIAQSVGSSLVRFVIDDADYQPSVQQIRDLLFECLSELDSVILAIENHDRLSAYTLQSLLEEVDSDRIGICLDTANSLGAGEGLDTVLAALAPWVVNLHIKDFAIGRISTKMGFWIEGRPAGAGLLKIHELIDQLNKNPRCQSAILELWTPSAETWEATIRKEAQWVRQSCEYLRPLLTPVHDHD